MINNITNLHIVDSTQTYLKDHLETTNTYDAVFATTQTNGYGRTGNWDSQYENLYFSKLLPTDENNHLTAICSMHMLASKYYPDVEIKVPNDLYIGSKKIGGFIIENTNNKSILGIGINFNGSDNKFASISEYTNVRYDIEELALELDEFINLNLQVPLDMLETYYKLNCHIVGKDVNYIELASGDTFTGTVTELSANTITIDNLEFNQMQIKILDK